MFLRCRDGKLIGVVAGTECTTSHGEIVGYWQVLGGLGHGRVFGIEERFMMVCWQRQPFHLICMMLRQIGSAKSVLDERICEGSEDKTFLWIHEMQKTLAQTIILYHNIRNRITPSLCKSEGKRGRGWRKAEGRTRS
jgi:hypothetical protein